MLPKNYIRLNAKPPGGKFPPPRNFVDFQYDPETGKIAAKDHAGNEVFFSSSSDGGYESQAVPVGSAVAIPHNTPTTAVSLSLTPGVWDVEGNLNFLNLSATVTQYESVLNSENSRLADGTEAYLNGLGTASTVSICMPRKRVTVAAGTTVTMRLVAFALYTGSGVSGFGSMTAVQVG